MSWFYRLMYALRYTPWDRTQVPLPLRDLVEGFEALPPGDALDLGCGGGRNAVYLAQHGWKVTGIDIVARAIRTARSRASEALVDVRLFEGDVTRAAELVGPERFSLIFDFGCLHGLPVRLRDRYFRTVNSVAQPHATLLLFGFTKPMPMTPGVTRDELEERLGPHWRLSWSGPDRSSDPTAAMRSAASTWFRFDRVAPG